jgi:hypothetical protein
MVMLLVTVVLLNLLIAVVSDHYNEVLARSRANFQRERACMLLQALNSMGNSAALRCGRMKWVYVVKPRDN